MKQNIFAAVCLTGLLLRPIAGRSQSYMIDWFKVAGGGGTSTGGVYSVSATIGQPDASGAMTGGNYSVTGGYWSLYAVVQTPGAPKLTITYSSGNVILSWPTNSTGFNASQFVLEFATNFGSPTDWQTNLAPVIVIGGQNIVINPVTATPMFFRLFSQQ